MGINVFKRQHTERLTQRINEQKKLADSLQIVFKTRPSSSAKKGEGTWYVSSFKDSRGIVPSPKISNKINIFREDG